MMGCSIYVLRDPVTNMTRYIGRTKLLLKRRLSLHISDSYTGINPKDLWIRQLNGVGYEPIIELIENVDDNECLEAERTWISYFEFIGAPLFNLQSTGKSRKWNSNNRHLNLELRQQQREQHNAEKEKFRAQKELQLRQRQVR